MLYPYCGSLPSNQRLYKIIQQYNLLTKSITVLHFSPSHALYVLFKGDTYEDATINTPLKRKKHFLPPYHVRIYSVTGLQKRLEQVGFKTEILNFETNFPNYHGLLPKETIIKCQKLTK